MVKMGLISERFPNGVASDAIRLACEANLDLAISVDKGVWSVVGNGEIILTTDTRDSVDAFLCGLAMAYINLPDWARRMLADMGDHLSCAPTDLSPPNSHGS
jgi:hypothetical protein